MPVLCVSAVVLCRYMRCGQGAICQKKTGGDVFFGFFVMSIFYIFRLMVGMVGIGIMVSLHFEQLNNHGGGG